MAWRCSPGLPPPSCLLLAAPPVQALLCLPPAPTDQVALHRDDAAAGSTSAATAAGGACALATRARTPGVIRTLNTAPQQQCLLLQLAGHPGVRGAAHLDCICCRPNPRRAKTLYAAGQGRRHRRTRRPGCATRPSGGRQQAYRWGLWGASQAHGAHARPRGPAAPCGVPGGQAAAVFGVRSSALPCSPTPPRTAPPQPSTRAPQPSLPPCPFAAGSAARIR
jgi:hypothetical protein